MTSGIASRWKILSGHGEGKSDKWGGLLSPLDNDLRRYIIHYGERTGAAGDMFDAATSNSKSTKQNFFSDACLVKGNDFHYTVTDFIYAGSSGTAVDVKPAWFGYVAVTTDEGKRALGRRDILVVWRGTIKTKEWINNVRVVLSPASLLFGSATQAKVHTGFLSLYTGTTPNSVHNSTSAREQVRQAVGRLLNQYLHEEVSITVTGFSLGAALATLNAMDIVANGYNKPTGNPSKAFRVTAFVFAGPRVGDSAFNQELTHGLSSNLRLMRITNARDPVHTVPTGSYVHLGHQELAIDTGKSPFLKWRPRGRSVVDDDYFDPNSVPEIPEEGKVPGESDRTGRGLTNVLREYFSAHNMDVYLHGVAGVKTEAPNEFSLDKDNGPHDYVLVNKYLDRLLPKYNIPGYWWEVNRQKMEQQENGRWKVK